MPKMERRSFLASAISAFPGALLVQSAKNSTPGRVVRVPSGEDRFGEHHTLGVSATDFKVATPDSSGDERLHGG